MISRQLCRMDRRLQVPHEFRTLAFDFLLASAQRTWGDKTRNSKTAAPEKAAAGSEPHHPIPTGSIPPIAGRGRSGGPQARALCLDAYQAQWPAAAASSFRRRGCSSTTIARSRPPKATVRAHSTRTRNRDINNEGPSSAGLLLLPCFSSCYCNVSALVTALVTADEPQANLPKQYGQAHRKMQTTPGEQPASK